MNVLPGVQRFRRKEAFYSLILAPLEYVTASLRKGDEWELDDLSELARRCRALADAYDLRAEIANHEDDNLNLEITGEKK